MRRLPRTMPVARFARVTRLFSSAVLLTTLSACGGSSQPAPGALLNADLEPRRPETPVEEEPGPDGLRVRLLDRGDEPHREIRYDRRAGVEETGRIQMIMSVATATADGRQGQHRSAPIELDFEVGPTETVDDHRIRYSYRITDVRLATPEDTPPEVLAEVQRATEPLRHLSSTVVVDDRGIVHEVQADIPEGIDAQTLTLLANIRLSLLSPVLPGPGIGEGAAWEVTHEIDHGDFTVHQVASYELVSLEEHTGRLQVGIRQHVPPGPVGPDGAPTGEIMEYETIGGGFVEFDLRHLIPEAQIAGRTHVEAAVRTGGVIVPAQSESSIAVRVEPSR